MSNKLIIKGARVHNLKNIDLEIPKNKLIIFTGISGSGKSSMAMDTIYAEGQRRYVESLSSYARQFLGMMDKPDVDSIEGLSPAIAIDQKTVSHNPRSTVGTITEIYDYFRLLFARIGHPHCHICNREISRQSIDQMTNNSLDDIKIQLKNPLNKNIKFIIFSPVIRDRKGEFSQLFEDLRKKGFNKVRIDKIIYSLDQDIVLIKTNKHTIDVFIDKFIVDRSTFKNKELLKKTRKRLLEAFVLATTLSQGLALVTYVLDTSFSFPDVPKKMNDVLYSEKYSCPFCNISFAEIEPRIFSFNSPHGACPTCTGIGKIDKIDAGLILNKNLSISEGGVLPLAKAILSDTWLGRIITTVAAEIGISLTEPIGRISENKLEKLLYGTGEQIYEVKGPNRYGKIVTINEVFIGIIPILKRRLSETESDFVRNEIGKYITEEICQTCLGNRLKKEALSITITGNSIIEVTSMDIKSILLWIEGITSKISNKELQIADLILKEINGRLNFLISVGLDYLTLARSASTLSGGEAQRIRLASQIGSGLSGVLYVLDEPSIGLHPKDNIKLIDTLKSLRNMGNSVIVVEHDKEMMLHSDYIVDFGPKAGREGGKIIAQGDVMEIINNPSSITGKYLSKNKVIKVKNKIFTQINDKIILKNCSENNLKQLDITIPLNKFVCITGVSGSGKSTLLVDTIYPALAKTFNPYYKGKIGKHDEIIGIEKIKKVILVDQSPIGKTPRSNPATYTQAFTFIRELFANVPEARIRGYKQGRFSFNIKGGRCEACQGEGNIKIEMQFLPDVYVTCDICHGTRFNTETLEILYKGKNIAEILKMTVAEAYQFFINIPHLSHKLKTLHDVGLDYIELGQPAPQLSGGEAQRVKLATELSKTHMDKVLFILDEPTTGLHFEDLEKLLFILRSLVDKGNTVIVIEHNMDVIKNADHIIDLGPEGGDKGGFIIAQGNVEDIIANKNSYTGLHLRKEL